MSTCSHGCTGGRSAIKSAAHMTNSDATAEQHRRHMDDTAATCQGGAGFSRSTGLPSRMGKATADLKTKVPDEVKFAFAKLASSCGLTESELLRDMVVLRLYGSETVLSMQRERLRMVAGVETESGPNEA